MKSILLSIRPEWVAKILNGEKTIEVRRKFPEDFVGWVYIYCTKESNKRYQLAKYKDIFAFGVKSNEEVIGNKYQTINGKVVARFWCDKVEEISYNYRSDFTSVYTDTLDTEDLEKQACLTGHEFAKYLQGNYGYAIHISKLEIFDKPKELSEFRLHYGYKECKSKNCSYDGGCWLCELTNPPQNFCYVED